MRGTHLSPWAFSYLVPHQHAMRLSRQHGKERGNWSTVRAVRDDTRASDVRSSAGALLSGVVTVAQQHTNSCAPVPVSSICACVVVSTDRAASTMLAVVAWA